MAAKRILRSEDEISREKLMHERHNYTDKQARELGYPNAEVLQLSDHLSAIAGQWRTTQNPALVEKYREILYSMILKGYDIDTLPLQDQLPEELMPELPPPAVRQAIKEAYRNLLAG